MAETQVAEKGQTASTSTGVRVPQLNEVRIAGRLGRDPDVKVLEDKQVVANLSIAVNRSFKDGEGKWQEKVDFVRVTAWGKTAEYARDHYKKGTAVIVEGPLRENKWEGKDGEKHQTVYIEATKIQALAKEEKKGAELER